MINCGVIRKRLAHGIPAFICDINALENQFFDAQVFGKSPKQKEKVIISKTDVLISQTVIALTSKAFDAGVSAQSICKELRVETARLK